VTNWSLILSIANTHLLTKLKQTSIAALGVTFGIGAYITLVCFMTGLNAMLDDLILNQTPHIHIYNEIKPSNEQPIDLYDEFENSLNVVHSIRPKVTQKRIHNASPIMNYLAHNKEVKAGTTQGRNTDLLYSRVYRNWR
jgi:lipoprotein-releasing system permease protein